MSREDVCRLGQALHRPFGEPHATTEAGGDDLGALLLGDSGGVPCDRVVGQDPRDEQTLPLEQHGPSSQSDGARCYEAMAERS